MQGEASNLIFAPGPSAELWFLGSNGKDSAFGKWGPRQRYVLALKEDLDGCSSFEHMY